MQVLTKEYESRTITQAGGKIEYRELSTPNFTLILSSDGEQFLGDHPQILGLLGEYATEIAQGSNMPHVVRRVYQKAHSNHNKRPEGTIFQLHHNDTPLSFLVKEYDLTPEGNRYSRNPNLSLDQQRKKQRQRWESTIARSQYMQARLQGANLGEGITADVAVPFGMLLVHDPHTQDIAFAASLHTEIPGTLLSRVLEPDAVYSDNSQFHQTTNIWKSRLIAAYKRLTQRIYSTKQQLRHESVEFNPDAFGMEAYPENCMVSVYGSNNDQIRLTLFDQ